MILLQTKRFVKKAAVFSGLDFFLSRRSSAGLILGFHHIVHADGGMLSQRITPTSLAEFEGVLQYLRSRGYSFVSLDEIVSGADCSHKVAVTFDDGFRSVYEKAFPVLRQLQIPFTIFFTTAMLGADRLLWLHRIYAAVDRLSPEEVFRVMDHHFLPIQPKTSLKTALGILIHQESPDKLLAFAEDLATNARLGVEDESRISGRLYLQPVEVEEMMQNGMIIGAHGHNHWSMNLLDQAATEKEVVMCEEHIRDVFGFKVNHYAVSYGISNPYVNALLRQRGYRSLSTAGPGLVWQNTDPYALPRLMAETGAFDLAGQITLLQLQGRGNRSDASF